MQQAADSDTILRVDDILYISGGEAIVKVFAEKYKLEYILIDDEYEFEIKDIVE